MFHPKLCLYRTGGISVKETVIKINITNNHDSNGLESIIIIMIIIMIVIIMIMIVIVIVIVMGVLN